MSKITRFFFILFFFYSNAVWSQDGAKAALEQDAVFIQNAGQWSDGSLFYFANGDIQATFFKDRVRFAMVRISEHKHPGEFTEVKGERIQRKTEESRVQAQVWDLIYANASDFRIEASEQEKSYMGFVNQNTNSKILYPNAYKTLTIRGLYNGVDAQFVIENGQLKINYLFDNQNKISNIRIQINGWQKTSVNSNGNLVLSGKYNEITDSIPMSYLQVGNNKISVTAKYIQLSENYFGFALESQPDGDLPLVVDPLYLDYSTYFYGKLNNGGNYIYDVEVDKNNYSYLVGYTNDKFDGTPGTYDTILNNTDGFLAKMPIAGGTPLYIIYIGGSQWEYAYAMAATANGDCYVTGYTMSTDFPTTSGVLEPSRPSSSTYTSFVFAIKSDGSTLIYSSYIRGWSWVVDVNEQGQVYIAPYGDAPYTETANINPVGQVGGNPEANVIRLNSAGSKILDCVTLKGDYAEYVYALTVDAKNQVYVAGATNSDNLPVTSGLKNFGGAFKGGSYDGFLFKIDSGFTKYLISKYIGTTGYDYISAITVNDLEEIFIEGIAGAAELPVATNSYPGGGSTTGWGGASFIMKIQKSGLYPMWTTYIINNTWAWRQRISVNAKDEVLFAGTTWANNLPTTSDAYQKTLKSAPDGYLGKLGTLGQINYLSYYGGSNYEYLFAVQTKRIGCVTQLIMGGYSASKDWPLKNPWKSAPSGTGFWSGAVCKWRDTLRVDPIEIGPDQVICDRVYRILDAGNKGASYKWSTGDTVRSIIAKQPGKYWVTASYGCGYVSDTAVYKTTPSAKLYLPSDTLVCDQYTVVLDARNDTIKGIRYLWSTGDTTQTTKVTKSGIYYLEMQTPVCGVRYDTINLDKQYSPKTGITPRDTTVCMPFNLDLYSGSDTIKAAYLWNTGDTTRNITIQKAGIYEVKINNICGIISSQTEITSDTVPTISYTVDSLLCDKSAYITPTGNKSSYTALKWSDGADSLVRTFHQSGNWTVEIKNQCATRTDTVKLVFETTPKAFTIPDYTWCDSIFASFKINDNLNTTIYWSTGDTGHVFNIDKTGMVIGKAINLCGSASDTFNVIAKYTPVVLLGKDTLVCDQKTFLIQPVTLKNFDSIYWNNGIKTNTLNITQPGIYSLHAMSSCGTAIDDIEIKFLEKPTVNTSQDALFCDAVTSGFTIDATLGGGLATGAWNDGSTNLILPVNTSGTYIYKSTNACGTDADTTLVDLYISPVVDLGLDSSYCGLPDITFDAGIGFASYLWNNGSTGQYLKLKEFGKYSVTVTDQHGCKGSDEIEITAFCNLIFYVPASFTPNHDGVNDMFGPVSKDVENLRFHIYNRWGQEVFFTNDPNGKWDGTFSGLSVNDGVYVWKANFSSYNKRYEMNGVITLLR
ncbi:MAG: gliding motility-associated C-terminal domain-containing protein [Bacteroidetes bacterium]|nr:gliding motility-associated C-terminal domain-containing protein [Bacteroidota bacterium]